ncbi:MAG: response regulator transcription factor [Ignavibacteriae bacterium]|nr:response regulator transcription factor [Ignavibacteriota bacterium]
MKKILVIDDDKSIRESTQELLEIVGYDVKVAEDGTKGIKLAKEFIPDIIICDISMPILDGYSVFNELSKNPNTSVIPFIFLTAKAEITDLKYGMQLGADDYICKPFSSNELINSIELRSKKKDNIIEFYGSRNGKEIKNENGHDKNDLDKESQILLMVGNHPQNFKIGYIVYIESLEKYSKLFTSDGKKVIVRKMMKEWQEILPENLFIRIHRSTIINLDYVKKFEKWFNYSYRVFLDKVEEPFIVSRRNSEKLRKR